MTYTLGIDTSHHVAVGVARDGEVVARSVVEDSRAHVEELVPSVLRACAEAGIALTDIDEIAVGMGPGPFTGLRVGVATAWTLAPTATAAHTPTDRHANRGRPPSAHAERAGL